MPGEELIADDLRKLTGNVKLMQVLAATWALKDTESARKLRQDAAARKRAYRQRLSADRGCRLTGLQLNHSEPGETQPQKGVSVIGSRIGAGPGSGAREKFVAPVRAFNIIDH